MRQLWLFSLFTPFIHPLRHMCTRVSKESFIAHPEASPSLGIWILLPLSLNPLSSHQSICLIHFSILFSSLSAIIIKMSFSWSLDVDEASGIILGFMVQKCKCTGFLLTNLFFPQCYFLPSLILFSQPPPTIFSVFSPQLSGLCVI